MKGEGGTLHRSDPGGRNERQSTPVHDRSLYTTFVTHDVQGREGYVSGGVRKGKTSSELLSPRVYVFLRFKTSLLSTKGIEWLPDPKDRWRLQSDCNSVSKSVVLVLPRLDLW